MSRPTEPGYYWLADAMGLGWEIVRVWLEGGEVWFSRVGCDSAFRSDRWVSDDQWGGRITQNLLPIRHPHSKAKELL